MPESAIEEHWERAYRFAAMLTLNQQDTADIAQEALLRAIRKLDHFDPEKGSFEVWLWRIVLNTARDAGRASGRRHSLLERLHRDRRTDQADDPETLAVARIADQDLLTAIRELPIRPRTLISLRFGAQLSYREIADVMGGSEQAALMSVRRALAVLRKRLQEVNPT